MIFKMKIDKLLITAIVAFLCMPFTSFAQKYNLDIQKSSLIVFGTSNIHDWDIKTENQKGFILINAENSLQIKELNIVVEAESLKSGRGGMDKNTYKALNTNDYKTIKFNLISSDKITDLGNGNYNVTAKGDLTISGVTKRITLEFKVNIVSNLVSITGEKNIKMTDYKIDPPKALLGTIKTGDDVLIKFNTILKK